MSVPGNIPDEPPSRRRPSAWLQEKLLERRIVLVTGRLDDDLAAEAAAALMILDTTDDAPIELHLDSPDGTLESAFVLIDTLDLLHATLRAHCRGQVGGPAIGIAAAADHRSAFPHTRFRLFQPTAQFSGTPDRLAQSTATGAALEVPRSPRAAHGPACRGDRRGHAARALPRRSGSARLRAHRRDQHHPMSLDGARVQSWRPSRSPCSPPCSACQPRAPALQFARTRSLTGADGLSRRPGGPFLCCKAVLPHMRRKRWGRIVNVAPVAAKRISFTGAASYTASQAGLLGFTRHLAYDVAPHGINVNAICPGPTMTPMYERKADEALAKSLC